MDPNSKESRTLTHVLDVVTFGEAMLLLVADRPGPLEAAGSFYKRSAGAETNVAIGLARLGLKVAWASRLGSGEGSGVKSKLSAAASEWKPAWA